MMENNDQGLIRIELRTDKDVGNRFNDYVEALQEHIMSDVMLHATARLEILESIIRVLVDDYGVTPNQMKVIEDRNHMYGSGPKIWIEVDQSITPVYILVDGDKEPFKAQKSEEKEDVWHLGM